VWSLVVERVARAAGLTEVVASEHDILDGVAWSLA
jgi:exopolyphosphatase/guanosine-5'-triphosphate,3'-diphosphate pyrophosphatase